MNLQTKLLKDLQQALRAQDSQRLKTLRLIKAAITNLEIEHGHSLTDDDILGVINREAKNRREIVAEYSKLDRQDLVEEGKSELHILEEYIPSQADRVEIETLARQTITELNAHDLSQMGPVMRQLMQQLKGRVDGHLVNQVVHDLLSES